MDYRLTEPIGRRATVGLIVLQSDETIEAEFRRLFSAPDVATYVSRVPSGADVTPETLAAMAAEIPRAAGLLPPSLSFDAVAYCCTSGATVIGPDRVADLVRNGARTGAVSDPLSAVTAALRALETRRIAMLTPYIESVTAPMRQALTAQGFEICNYLSFNEKSEERVARIAPESIRDAAIAAAGNGAEAVFLSCTNLRTLDVIDEIEATLGLPCISSNQALAWHLAQLAEVQCDARIGQLLRMKG